MRLHPRTMPTQRARAELGMWLVKFQEDHDLTDIEVAQMLTEQLGSVLKYMLRAERHPDDPEQKADEE